MAATINISLPEPLKAYVDAQTEAGNYGTPQEFIRELIQDDRDRHRRNLEERLLDALKDESNAIEISDEDWANGNVVRTLKAYARKVRERVSA
jgi:antitoxin ParD1/3/4